jgi:hypothetical protein
MAATMCEGHGEVKENGAEAEGRRRSDCHLPLPTVRMTQGVYTIGAGFSY